jgi:CheY-like chemotaxis protein
MPNDPYVPTLLYIEDDEAFAWAFQTIALEKKCNLSMVIAGNRDIAMSVLAKAEAFQDVRTPDLILLDLDLPILNGFQIFMEIQGMPEFAAVPVIFFSSSQRPSDRNRALAMGAMAYILKPGDLDGISDAIDLICTFIPAAA